MSKHKERTLNDLYNVTFTLSQPKITPLLRGSHRMQGPFVEPICNYQTNTVTAEVNKESILCPQNQSVGGKLVSGTCNVCSSPCSSCFPSQNLMESKVDELSGETGMINSSSFSVNDVSSSNKNRKYEISQSNEINSAIRTSSSSLSFSADAEIKANARTSDVSSATSDGAVLAKLKDPKSFEGLDDSMSCIIGGDEANKLSSFSKASEDKSSLQCSSTSSGKTINNQTSAGCVHVKNEADDGSPIDHSRQNESSGEENNKAPTEATSSGNAHSTGDSLENNHSSLKNDVASEASGDLPADTCPEKDDQKNVESPVSSDTKDALQSHQMDESEDSDIEEQDVKVCDICGDAGREDLLAICCKCTDGAEHTYCMREMLQKVPEMDWMCEECKFDEEMKNRKEDKSVKFDGNGKSYPTGQIAVGNNTIKTESKPPDFDGDIAYDAKTSGKRRMDDTEVYSAAKKQALETVPASPKTRSPNKLPALSRESSFKNSDKGKLKSANQISSGGLSVHDTPAWGSRLQTSRGTFSKSNSFSSLAAKRKVRLVDEGFLPKQKLVRESTGLDAKDSSTRSMSKSMSFRSISSSRNNVSESKVKMLSPRFSPAQDKGQMQTKERNQFERKNSFRSERSPGTSVPSRTDQRSAFRGDPSPLSSSSNIRDSRTGQLDSKPVSLLKSSGAVARRTRDISVHSDEAKKQTSLTSISTGAPAANKISSSDQRPDQGSARDDSSPNSDIAERPTSNTGEGLSDGLSQPSESKNVGERAKESSGRRLKHTGTGTKSLFCQKCKGSGHLTDSCTVDGSELSASDVSAVRNSREAPNGTSNLKAAIEAAMLKKPGICRKNRVVDQSDDLAVSNTNSETTAQDLLSGSSSRRILSSNEDGDGVSSNSMTGSHKQEIGSLTQLSVLPAEALTGEGNPVPILLSDGKSSLVDLQRYSLAAMSILSSTAIPDHEYIWQGAFEVQKSGRMLDLCDGIQAHLSSCASPNVLDAVNKFPQKVLFNEVARLSTWPIQFQEYGVKEDNIALFFFAKDIGSYERCYKILLENMIRNDTALKANLQGVELLIFPSNRLPEKSQRWNMMFFLWGVFRVKKVQATTGKPSVVLQDIPKLVMPSPENLRRLGPVDNVTSGNMSMDGEITASKESGCPLVNGNVDSKASQICDSPDTNVEHQEPRSMSYVAASHMNFAPERRQFGVFQVGDAGRECNVEVQSSSVPDVNSLSHLSTSEPVPVECGSLFDKQKPSRSDDEAAGHMQEKTSVGSMEKGFCSTNGRKFEINLEDEYKDEEASETSGSAATEPTRKVLNSDVLNHLKRPRSVETVMQSADSGVNQASRIYNDNDLLVEEAHHDKKLKTSIGASYGNSEQTSCSSDDLLSRVHGSSYGPYLPDTGYDEALSKAPVRECSGSAERYFFPVDPNLGKASSTPWQMHHPDNDRLSDRVPNLELALGGESNSQTQGIPPFLVGKVDKKIIQLQGGETQSLTQGIPPFLVGKVDKQITQDQGGETHPPTPGIPPFLVGKADKKVSQDHSSAKEAVGVEEVEDVSASLSLSLSFPFPEKEEQKGSVSQTEQAIPETRRSNTSLLFFEGLGNK